MFDYELIFVYDSHNSFRSEIIRIDTSMSKEKAILHAKKYILKWVRKDYGNNKAKRITSQKIWYNK